MIRVLLADDQLLVRAGFRSLLDAQPDISVIAEADDGLAAVRLARELVPDVVLMDIRMPQQDGLVATRLISADPALAAVRVVVLTTFELDEYVFEALRAGAAGFLVKDTEPAELLQAVRVVARGDALLSPGVTRAVISAFTDNGRAGGSGSGLVGMRERVAALGGSVRAERRAAGFEVEALLPTGPDTPSEPSERKQGDHR